MFALHDATVKLLVSDLSAWEVLFARSLVVLPLCFLLRQRPRARAATPWPVRRLLLLNAVIYALAWVAYYSAARHLQLAELETVYFASPLIATALAVAAARSESRALFTLGGAWRRLRRCRLSVRSR